MGSSTPKKAISAILGIVLGVCFAVFCPDVGLSDQGVRCLGILLGAVVWWVGGVLPSYGTAIVMVVLFSLVAGVETSVSMKAFSTDIWWLLVAAFGLSAGMKRSGLLKRMALGIVRVFPDTFAAQAGGLVVAGTLLGPLVPSMAAKVSMLTPLAQSIGETLGYERNSKPMQGLFLAMFTGVRTIAPAVLSASAIGYCLLGLLPADVRSQFDLFHWFLAALPWFVVVSLANYIAIALLYRPKPDGDETGRVERAHAEGDVSGASAPMSRHEKQMCLIIVTTVALWVTEPLHHVSAHIVALSAFAIALACGILGRDGFRKDVGWEALIFVGVALGLSNVFAVTGIQDWIVVAAAPAFEAIAGNPYLFVVGTALITLVIRFVIVSEMAYLNIVMVFLVPLCLGAGISPWVVGFSMFAVITPWFVLYQSATYLAAFYSVDGKMVRHADMAKYCVLYTLICMGGLVASVPYWQWMGLL